MISRSGPLVGPSIVPDFAKAMDELITVANEGHRPDSRLYNPPDKWLVEHMSIFQDLPQDEREDVLREASHLTQSAEKANAEGRAAARVWPDVVMRLDNGGLAFFSQLGVVRRPDLTQYFIDGFARNRDALAFEESNQVLFAEVFPYITTYMKEHFASGDAIVQSDRRIGDVPDRSFHARQLMFGTHYLQVPYMWRQLTFDLPEAERRGVPDILEVSIPNWLEDLSIPEDLKARVKEVGLTQLILKAPTKGLSLHLGFDYVGEHKMGPLSIAMFKVKQNNGVAVQAALSIARTRTLDGVLKNTAMVTIGPSLHGKSTLTIMIELAKSELARLLKLADDPEEGIYPMNDDIVLLQPLPRTIEAAIAGKKVEISHGVDGTENNFYAVPFGLTHEDDPITYDVVRGTLEAPNLQETLENVPVNPDTGQPNYLKNPVRNMRMILSRPRLLARKNAERLLEAITDGQTSDAVHVPMEHTDRVFWQAVMRQNTVIPPLRRLRLEQFIRVLMYGEAVQMGAATGAIGRPYVEYFSDPFIIGLEDDNANLMHRILLQMAEGGQLQEYFAFNTGGVGADTNEEASGAKYRKIPRELTLMLQEALLRGAVRFEYDDILGSDLAVAIVDESGEEVLDLRKEWLPRVIYGEEEYARRAVELKRRRYYGRDATDRAGILRYTKVVNELISTSVIPPPTDERALAWLLSFYWSVDQAYDSLPELATHVHEGQRPAPAYLEALQEMYQSALAEGLQLANQSRDALSRLGIGGYKVQ